MKKNKGRKEGYRIIRLGLRMIFYREWSGKPLLIKDVCDIQEKQKVMELCGRQCFMKRKTIEQAIRRKHAYTQEWRTSRRLVWLERSEQWEWGGADFKDLLFIETEQVGSLSTSRTSATSLNVLGNTRGAQQKSDTNWLNFEKDRSGSF